MRTRYIQSASGAKKLLWHIWCGIVCSDSCCSASGKRGALDCTHSAQLWRALFEYTLEDLEARYPLLLVSAKVVKWQIRPYDTYMFIVLRRAD